MNDKILAGPWNIVYGPFKNIINTILGHYLQEKNEKLRGENPVNLLQALPTKWSPQ